MRRLFLIILASALLNQSAQAGAADPPGTIYIDGKPCGSFCQLFFDLPQVAEPAEETGPAIREPAAALSRNRPRPRKAYQRFRRMLVERVPLPRARPVVVLPEAYAAESQSVSGRDDAKAAPAMKTVMQLSDAAELAARFTAEASASMSRGNISGDDDITGSASKPDRRVVILATRDRIAAVSDLAAHAVSIDASLSSGALAVEIRTAMVAAGATRIDLTPSTTSPIDPLQEGQVDAAILGVVTPEAAELFSAVAGYRIFGIPLSPQ